MELGYENSAFREGLKLSLQYVRCVEVFAKHFISAVETEAVEIRVNPVRSLFTALRFFTRPFASWHRAIGTRIIGFRRKTSYRVKITVPFFSPWN